MAATITVAVIKTDGQIEFQQIHRGERTMLEDMQKIVGGNITYFPHHQGYESPLHAVGNDEGMLIPLPYNGVASATLEQLGFYQTDVFGDIFIIGKDDKSLTTKQKTAITAAATTEK